MQKGFSDVDKRFSLVDKQINQLTLNMITGFDRASNRADSLETKIDKRIDEVLSIIDGYAGKIDTYAQEMAAMDHKINRLEKYIQVLADKAGVDLNKIHA